MAVERLTILEEKLHYVFDYLKAEMIEQLLLQGHRLTGTLEQSITHEIIQTVDVIDMEASFVFYGRFVDTGRRSGGKKVPIDALERWIRLKGFESDAKKIRGMAFAIQTTIFKKGISQPATWKGESTKDWMSKTLEINEERIASDIQFAVEEQMEIIVFNIVQEVNTKLRAA